MGECATENNERFLRRAMEGPVLEYLIEAALQEHLAEAETQLRRRVGEALIEESAEEAEAWREGTLKRERRQKGAEVVKWDDQVEARMSQERSDAIRKARLSFRRVLRRQLGDAPRLLGMHQLSSDGTVEVVYGKKRPNECCPSVIGVDCEGCTKRPQKELEDFGIGQEKLEELLLAGEGIDSEIVAEVRRQLAAAFQTEKAKQRSPSPYAMRHEWTQVAQLLGVTPGIMKRGGEVAYFIRVERMLAKQQAQDEPVLEDTAIDRVMDFHAIVNAFLAHHEKQMEEALAAK